MWMDPSPAKRYAGSEGVGFRFLVLGFCMVEVCNNRYYAV